MNRCISLIEEVERQDIQRVRIARSAELLAAAIANASDNHLAVTLVKNEYGEPERVFLSDERITAMLIVADNVVYRRDARTPKYVPVRVNAEIDVFDFVLLFVEGKFHK